MKKLIVGGCSITHGAEIVDGFMHPDNIKHSYSYHLANWFNADLVNVALSGGSNDNIFHSIIEEIDSSHPDGIHSVIAAWTRVNRLHWVNKGRHWFFIPGWASSMENLYNWDRKQKEPCEVYITSDQKNLLDTLYEQHKFFIDNYLDDTEYLDKKLDHYKKALRSYCATKNIKYIEFDIFDLYPCLNRDHPTAEEHLELAKEICQTFYQSTPPGFN